MERYGGNKTQNFIDAVPIMPSFWIMDLRICGEGTAQIPLSPPATTGPLERI